MRIKKIVRVSAESLPRAIFRITCGRNLFYYSAAEADATGIEHAVLSRGNGALFFIEIDANAAVGEKGETGFLQGLTVTDTDEDFAACHGFGYKIELFSDERRGIEFVGLALIDVENVVFNVFSDNVPGLGVVLTRYAPDAETFVLTERVKEYAFVSADDFTVESAYFSFFHRNILRQKLAEISLAYKTNPRGIFLFRGYQSVTLSKFPNRVLIDNVGEREKYVFQLLFRHLIEKIRLVFVLVRRAGKIRPAVLFRYTAVMTGGNVIGADFRGIIAEDTEFYLTIAENVGVRRSAERIFFHEMRKDVVVIFFGKIYGVVGYPYRGTNAPNVGIVLFGSATTVFVGLAPVIHKKSDNVVTLLFEKKSRYAAVHPSAHTYDYGFCHITLRFLLFYLDFITTAAFWQRNNSLIKRGSRNEGSNF